MAKPRSRQKDWAWQAYRGIENCIFPSFTPDFQSLDEEGIRHDVRQSIAHGFASTVCAVETGLSFEEAKRMVAIVADEAKGRILVSVNLIFDSIDQNVEMVRHCASVGCQSALLGYPFHFYPQDADAIYQASKRVAEAADVAILLYPSHKFNFGRLDPMGFPLSVIDRCLEIDNVVAVKMGLLEPGFIHEVYRRYNDWVVIEFPWERWWPLLRQNYKMQFAGAGAYELFQSPEKPLLVQYFNHLLADEMDAAMDIYWRLTPARMTFEQQFMPTQALGSYHWPQQKYYQFLTGGNGGYTRQPVMKLLQHELDDAKRAVRALGIEPTDDDALFYEGRANRARRVGRG